MHIARKILTILLKTVASVVMIAVMAVIATSVSPVYTFEKTGKKHVCFENGDRYYGEVFGLGEDYEPKEFVEPKGYENLPYETEKEV